MAKAKLTTSEVKSIVKPLIQEEGYVHPLTDMFKQKPELLQTLTSIGIYRIPDSNKFVSYVIKSKGAEIVSLEVSEPDLRAIAEEASKIAFVELFMSKEM